MPTWVRCRGRQTGHEFDLDSKDVRIRDGRVKVLTRYPEKSGSTARPRPPKHRVKLTGSPTVVQQAEQKSAENTEE